MFNLQLKMPNASEKLIKKVMEYKYSSVYLSPNRELRAYLTRTEANRFPLPHKLLRERPFEVVIEATEFGGMCHGDGSAHVVAGMSGKSLRPYRIKKDPGPCSEHAFFAVPELLLSVTASFVNRGPMFVKIVEVGVTLTLDKSAAILTNRVIWEGLANDLPRKIGQYYNVVTAATEKARCSNCRCVHYAH